MTYMSYCDFINFYLLISILPQQKALLTLPKTSTFFFKNKYLYK